MGSGRSSIVYAYQHEEASEGASAIYRAKKSLQGFIETPHERCHTMRDIIVRSVLEYPTKKCMGQIHVKTDQHHKETREITYMTYRECFDRAKLIGSGLINLELNSPAQDMTFVKSGRMSFVGIYSKNRIEWGLTDMACVLHGITSIPIYDTFGPENITHCLEQTAITACFCSKENAATLVKMERTANLKTLILFEKVDPRTRQQWEQKFKILFLDDLIKSGDESLVDFQQIPVEADDCLTFSYTSGTTGPPKGVMLSHRNFTTMIAATSSVDQINFSQNDVYLSFLPLPHCFQRAFFHTILNAGALVIFFCGDIKKMKRDLQVAKPTLFGGVPRIYSKIVEGIYEQANKRNYLMQKLFWFALNWKIDAMKRNGNVQNFFLDLLIFKNIQKKFGGKIRLMVTGSAPIKQETQRAMMAFMSAPLIEGYGQSQNLAGAFIQRPRDCKLGHVGGILTGLQFRLTDLPDLNYYHTDRDENGVLTPRGQLQVRGPQVFLGYYKQKKKTEATMSKDGWLKTGDIGQIIQGSLAMKIIDRKKNMFKLSQGEYIAAEKVEAVYSKCEFIGQAFLHGQSDQDFAVLIISVDQGQIKKIAKEVNVDGSLEQICEKKEVRNAVFKKLEDEGKKAGLQGFEKAKNVWLEPQPFSKLDLVTDTEKLKRAQAKEHYKEQIQKMYEQGKMPLN